MSEEFFSVVTYVPVSHAEAVRAAMAKAGAGKLGNYAACTFSVRGTGRFLPLADANPHTGDIGTPTEADEERIETLCAKEHLDAVFAAIRESHPYEEPALHATSVLL